MSLSPPDNDASFFFYEKEVIDEKYFILYDEQVSKEDVVCLARFLKKIGFLSGPQAQIHITKPGDRFIKT